MGSQEMNAIFEARRSLQIPSAGGLSRLGQHGCGLWGDLCGDMWHDLWGDGLDPSWFGVGPQDSLYRQWAALRRSESAVAGLGPDLHRDMPRDLSGARRDG